MRYNLEGSGYVVRCYRNTRDALELIEHPADVALLDYANAPIDGIELCRLLRAGTRMPVIFLSAWAEKLPEMLKRGGLVPADAYIGLPFSPTAVTKVIEAVLNCRAV